MKQLLLALAFLVCLGCQPKEQGATNAREAWNHATTLEAYEQVGSKNSKWDGDAKQALKEYLKLRGQSFTNREQQTLAMNMAGIYASTAVSKGCDDPLIGYLACRYSVELSNAEITKRLCDVADRMEVSDYAPVRKFFPNLRASQYLWKGRDTNVWSRVAQFERAAMNNFAAMTQDKGTPIQEIDETGHELINTVSGQEWALRTIIETAMPQLQQNWPEEEATHALIAVLYYNYAWRARGSGYADKVTEEGWKGFKERLAVATAAAEKAWSLNPKNTRIPTLMIKLAEANQTDRKEMELWFTRAMDLEPNNYDACYAKLHYLLPQWYGSREEMVLFGRECVQSEKWTGTVPLILADAHDQIARYIKDKEDRKAYWLEPEVWADLDSAYRKFFAANPDAVAWRHNYARHAYKCEQWETLNEQIKLLGPVNYSYFGGESEFDKMVELAKTHAAKTAGKE